MADQKLTKRQQQIFDFIKRYTSEKGYPPTVRDIGHAIGLTSSSTVHAHLANLERLGMLRRDPTKPRAMEVLVDKAKRAIVPSGLPLVGRVAAGTPILAEENVEEYVEVSPLAAGDGGDFVLEVRGDSMKNAGILNGDTVVVRSQETARNGEIVVAIVGQEDEAEAEATVKRYFRESDHIRLEPENESFEPIRSPDVKIAGRVIGVFRRVA
jgi:repressor LexA